MQIEINLPFEIATDDYHDFKFAENLYKKLDNDIIVEEVGFDSFSRKYYGIVFIEKDVHYNTIRSEILNAIGEY